MQPSKPVEILLVEDNPGDVYLTREALKEGKIYNAVHVAVDGEQAMAFLRALGPHAQAPRPDLILLDLNLPRKDGREVLAEIKADIALRSIPIVVMTGSQAEEDLIRAEHLNVHGYVTKPIDFGHFIAIIRSIEDFWLVIAKVRRAA